MSKVIFNLFEPDTVVASLSTYFGVDDSVMGDYLLNRYIINKDSMDMIAEALLFIERFNIDINSLDYDNICLRLKHITTSTDALDCLKEHGLRDLKFVLQEDTPLNKFLKDNDIEINVDNRIIKVEGTEHNIFNSKESKDLCVLQCEKDDCFGCEYKGRINRLWLKFYKYRCEIEAFSRGKDESIESYSCVKRNPEILWNFDEIIKCLGGNARLERNWYHGNDNKFYIIDFELSLSQLDKDVDNKLIKFLAVCMDTFYGSKSDVYVAINEGISIPFEKIINITEKARVY